MAYGRSYAQNRGSFISGLVRTVGRVAGTIGGPIGRVVQGVTDRVTAAPSRQLINTVMPGGTMTAASAGQRPRPGVKGAVQRLLPGGQSGYLPSRRMNPGNGKAARRAIRRIKAVRKMLQSIERELPRRPCGHGSRGVITRAEASRALRR